MRHTLTPVTVKNWLKSVYIYGSYPKIKTWVSLFGILCMSVYIRVIWYLLLHRGFVHYLLGLANLNTSGEGDFGQMSLEITCSARPDVDPPTNTH